jgi:hypothetical protein
VVDALNEEEALRGFENRAEIPGMRNLEHAFHDFAGEEPGGMRAGQPAEVAADGTCAWMLGAGASEFGEPGDTMVAVRDDVGAPSRGGLGRISEDCGADRFRLLTALASAIGRCCGRQSKLN